MSSSSAPPPHDSPQPNNNQFHTISLSPSNEDSGTTAPTKQGLKIGSAATRITVTNASNMSNNLNNHLTTVASMNSNSNKLSPFVVGPNENNATGSDGASMSGRSQRALRYANKKGPFPFAGIAASMFASLCFATSMTCIKLIPNGDSFQERNKQLFFRGVQMMIYTGITIIYTKSTFLIKRDEIWVNVLRSVFGFVAVYGAYTALIFISVGESQAIIFSAPIWTAILSYFILGEQFSLTILLGLPVSLLGIILIAHPDLIVDVREQVVEEIHYHHHEKQYIHPHWGSNSTTGHYVASNSTNLLKASVNLASTNYTLIGAESGPHSMYENANTYGLGADENSLADSYFETRLPGILISVGTSFLVSMVYIVLKFRKSTPVQTTTFYLGLITTVLCIILGSFIGYGNSPNTIREILLLIGMGFFSWLGQSALQWSTAYESASILSVIRAVDVVLCFIYGVLLLHEDVLWTSVVGAILILVVVAMIVLRNYITCPCLRNT